MTTDLTQICCTWLVHLNKYKSTASSLATDFTQIYCSTRQLTTHKSKFAIES